MKKCIGIALAVLMVLGFTGMAAANGHGGYVPAVGTIGADHGWMYSGYGAYVKVSDPWEYSCNGQFVIDCSGGKTGVDIDFVFNASVAQWVQLKVSARQVDWKVIKPGEYSMPSPIRFEYRSNGNLIFGFRDFTNLTGAKEKGDMDGDVIEASFQYQLPEESWTDWYSVADVNTCTIFVEEDQCHMWQDVLMNMKIVVEDCDSACEYYGGGTIRVILDEQKPWLGHKLGLEVI